MQCERNIPLERGSFCLFYEKTTTTTTIGPRIPSFSRKNRTKWSEKLKMTFLNHFHQGGHPGARPERVRCISRRRSPWPHVSRTWSCSRWPSHWVQRALNQGDSGGWSSEMGAAIELAVCGRCPWPAKLSFLPAVTGHKWRENAPEVLKKWGWWILPGSRRLGRLILILGRRADHHMIFHNFPYLFYHGFFVGDCSKFA